MKKIVLTIVIILGMTFAASAQYFNGNGQPNGGGLFGRGAMPNSEKDGIGFNSPILPNHGLNDNQDASEAPIGGGALLLIGFGAAYALSKKVAK